MIAVVLQPAVPMRAAPSHSAEQVSQLLFGETCELLSRDGACPVSTPGWSRVRTRFDNYIGYVSTKQLTPLTPSEAAQVEQWPLVVDTPTYTLSLTSPSLLPGQTMLAPITVPMGARLPQEHRLVIADRTLEHSFLPAENIAFRTFSIAYHLLNAPYLWGGRTLMGIDCSGFTQLVYKVYGTPIPRDASQQATVGTPVDSLSQACKGDLLFFANPQGRVTHVGLHFGNNAVIHASGRVRIDKIDPTGIYNHETLKYTHTLHSIRRIWQ